MCKIWYDNCIGANYTEKTGVSITHFIIGIPCKNDIAQHILSRIVSSTRICGSGTNLDPIIDVTNRYNDLCLFKKNRCKYLLTYIFPYLYPLFL